MRYIIIQLRHHITGNRNTPRIIANPHGISSLLSWVLLWRQTHFSHCQVSPAWVGVTGDVGKLVFKPWECKMPIQTGKESQAMTIAKLPD